MLKLYFCCESLNSCNKNDASPLLDQHVRNAFISFQGLNFLHTLWTLWCTLWATIHAHYHNNKDAHCVWKLFHLLLQWMDGEGRLEMCNMISPSPPLPSPPLSSIPELNNNSKAITQAQLCLWSKWKKTKFLVWSNIQSQIAYDLLIF